MKVLYATIGIIAILALALMITTPPSRFDQRTVFDLKTAIRTYEFEYGRMPIVSSKDFEGTVGPDLLRELIPISKAPKAPKAHHSPRKINLFSSESAVLHKETGTWRQGLQKSENSYELFDSFGRPFFVRIDANGDGLLKSPKDNGPLKEKVLVWTSGKDGQVKTWEDNIKSW